VIYLRAGLYAEGPTDYRFLLRLLNRHIDMLAASLFASGYEIADSVGIDAPADRPGGRAKRIAAAIEENIEACTLSSCTRTALATPTVRAPSTSSPASQRREHD
jgi:hypothetical protein